MTGSPVMADWHVHIGTLSLRNLKAGWEKLAPVCCCFLSDRLTQKPPPGICHGGVIEGAGLYFGVC